ncbi:hypothetical protein JHS3_16950 [Jeongeupia sp. HS-3]|nr:hypothetical protein JHS3_16950 [Jeongeupia sp. HS-3]
MSIAARLAGSEIVATAPPWPVATGCFASAANAAIIKILPSNALCFMLRPRKEKPCFHASSKLNDSLISAYPYDA